MNENKNAMNENKNRVSSKVKDDLMRRENITAQERDLNTRKKLGFYSRMIKLLIQNSLSDYDILYLWAPYTYNQQHCIYDSSLTEKIIGLLLFNTLLCHLCLFTLALTNPRALSPPASPPTTTGSWGRKFCGIKKMRKKTT